MAYDRIRSWGFRNAMSQAGVAMEALRRLNGALTLVLAWTVPTTVSAQQSATAGPPLLFDGVTVVDVERGKLIPAQRVVIVGNRIQTVGAVGTVKAPNGAQIVDARGKYLIPGLWDMHVHVNLGDTDISAGYLAFLPFGVTGVREAGYGKAPIDSLLRWRRAVAKGELLGPRVLLAGSIRGEDNNTGDLLQGGANAHSDEEARRLVLAYHAQGTDFIKTMRMPREMFFAIAAEARRLGIPFGGHAQQVSVSEASDSGASIIDHLHGHSQELLTACFGPEATASQCQPLAERLRRNGTWFVPTLSVLSDYVGIVEEHATPADATADSLGSFRIAHRVGLPIMAGSDQTSPKSLHMELWASAGEGLTPLEALQSATLNPAKYLRGTDSLGTVAPGKLADLVLLDANPLEDIHNTWKIRAVVTNGRYLDRAALDRLLVQTKTQWP